MSSALKAIDMNGEEFNNRSLAVSAAGQPPGAGGGSSFGGSRSRSDTDKTAFVKGFDRAKSSETVRIVF